MSQKASARTRKRPAGPALVAACCVLLTGASPSGASPPRAPVLADGIDLASTAGRGERRRIARLTEAADRAEAPARLTLDYPREGSVFPSDFAAPTFLWHDEAGASDAWLVDWSLRGGAAHVRVLLRGAFPQRGEIDERCISENNEIYEPTAYQASARSWKPSNEVWEALKRHASAEPAEATFYGYRLDDPGRVLSRGRFTLRVSADPVGAPIFYRDVPLAPSKTEEGVIKPLSKGAVPLIAWRLRDVGRSDSRVLLHDMPTCANCHSFSSDGRTLGMDVDGPQGDKGAYAIVPVEPRTEIRARQVISWNAFAGKPAGLNTLGFMSQISPDGRHVVSTVNEAVYVVNFKDYRFSQVFYPTRGILAYYSRETGEIKALPGADDPSFVHCDPAWTPDGKSLIFARAPARDPYERNKPLPEHANDPAETPMRYDLYRIPFNEGRGGIAEPLAGASDNGMSNTFPKVSPDGRWVVYVRCRNGQLLRPDSRLWIVPAEGGEAREMSCNLPLMNSWHSFSPNGRWLAFASKSNTPYTELFLTHIDERGNDSPALLIENSTAANRAVNLPEFVNVAYDEFVEIAVPAVDHVRRFQEGNELARQGRYEEAVARYELALSGDWQGWRVNDWTIHDNLSKTLLELDRHEEALEHVRAALRLNPYNAEMYGNLGYLLFERGLYDQAREQMSLAIQLTPRDPRAWYNRATLNLTLGRSADALADYTEALRLDPEYVEALNGRAVLSRGAGDVDAALADLDAAIRLAPQDATALYFRALARIDAGDFTGAAEDIERAVQATPEGSPQRIAIERLRSTLPD